MAGNAAGFSGLQLPSSSSIVLPASLISSSCTASRARQADASLRSVYVLTALVSTAKRGNERKRDPPARTERQRENGRGKETKDESRKGRGEGGGGEE